MQALITGGTGYLGRGFMRRVYDGPPKVAGSANYASTGIDHVRVYSRDEYKQDLCKQKFPDAEYILGDVQDEERLSLAMRGCDLVVHMAAIKYIPEAEFNVAECINVNLYGSESVLRAARRAEVPYVVGISTDKAAAPVNVYGMTKGLMERLFSDTARMLEGLHNFTCTRYGNVVGSTGSVIPLFERQMREKGQITVTNPNMTRFFISIDEAVDLILCAKGTRNGAVIVPKARAMRIGDLALTIANGDEDAIKIVGVRPGEKHNEAMIVPEESVRTVDMGWHYLMHRHGDPVPDPPEPFQVLSNFPTHWITPDEMCAMIEDARTI